MPKKAPNRTSRDYRAGYQAGFQLGRYGAGAPASDLNSWDMALTDALRRFPREKIIAAIEDLFAEHLLSLAQMLNTHMPDRDNRPCIEELNTHAGAIVTSLKTFLPAYQSTPTKGTP